MIKFEMLPVISVYDLEDALTERGVIEQGDSLSQILWEGDYMNDSYKCLYVGTEYGEDEEEQDGIDNGDEDEVKYYKVRRALREILQEAGIGTRCLVDVSW